MSNQVPESVQRYTSRPVTIEAIQWDGTADAATNIINWAMQHGATINYWCEAEDGCPGTDNGHVLRIRTLEGDMDASAGWWIIKGTENEFYPCKDSVFQRKYFTEQTSRFAEPQIPAEMRASLDEHLDNVRLLQRNLSVTTVHVRSDFLPIEERPRYVISSDIEVYGDLRG